MTNVSFTKRKGTMFMVVKFCIVDFTINEESSKIYLHLFTGSTLFFFNKYVVMLSQIAGLQIQYYQIMLKVKGKQYGRTVICTEIY